MVSISVSGGYKNTVSATDQPLPHMLGLRERYFESRKSDRPFLFRSHRMSPIRWRQHDLFDPLPDGDPFNMILLRNSLLTYYQGPDLQGAFMRVVARLIMG